MSIIGKVGRNTARVRFLNISIHVLLLLGSITMVYPFLLMLSSSVKSSVDSTQMNIIPKYLYDDTALYRKYLESRYNEESSRLMDNYPGSWISFAEVQLPQHPQPQMYQHWQEFIAVYRARNSVYNYYVAEQYGRGVYPLAQRQYRSILRQENSGDLGAFNRRYNTGAKSWEEIVVEEKEIFRRNFVSSTEGYLGRFRAYKESTSEWQRFYVNPDGAFVNGVLIPAFAGDLAAFNHKNGSDYGAWNEVTLPPQCPPLGSLLREYWLEYTREMLNIQHLSLREQAAPRFQAMLKEKYGSITLLNATWQSDYGNFQEVPVPQRLPDSGAIVEDLSFYIQHLAEPDEIRVRSIAVDFRDYLQSKYDDIVKYNAAMGTGYDSFASIPFPAADLDYHAFRERKGSIRREFITRNYAMALDQMLADARSLRNTGIYVLLSIFFAITVNPLAAYALSRFKPRFSHQVIMLFMLTMAFPAMVMGIPNFLMLKRLNLLNTFWALVLPAAADGYFIFLLKGFFDSLPKELYESARLDGAGEFRLFWQFTLYLSKPILAVIALGAFNAAYRNFLFAFIVCQDQSMWTLMVHIYELMQRASSGVGYAALVIAAIPTLAVFVFFQNIIIKGIVVPMEK